MASCEPIGLSPAGKHGRNESIESFGKPSPGYEYGAKGICKSPTNLELALPVQETPTLESKPYSSLQHTPVNDCEATKDLPVKEI